MNDMNENMPELSVVIPVYNEKDTVEEIVRRVRAVNVRKEIIIVNDGSKDGSKEKIDEIESAFVPDEHNLRMIAIHQPRNGGKGLAMKTGFKEARAEFVITQDADLEYDPKDYPAILEAVRKNNAKVLYGSRRLMKSNTQHSGLSFYVGGVIVTWFTNILFFSHLTDEPTGYKLFRKDLLDQITITENRFAWEPEITAKVLRKGIRIYEIPIHYYPRPIEEGKKINWKDGVAALWTLLKYRFVRIK